MPPKSGLAIRYTHALIAFMGVLLVFSFIADGLLVTQQRSQMLGEARRFAERELRLIETFIRDALGTRETEVVEAFLADWGEEDPDVVSFSATAPDGTVVARYQRTRPARYPVHTSQTVTWQGEPLVRLELIRDFAGVEEKLESVRMQLIGASVGFVLVLGLFLWFTVRRMALLPMERVEEELQLHRYRLERRVQERTAKLTAANKQLEKEIEDRELAQDDLRRHTERLKTLREIDQAILAARSPEETAAGALRHVRTLVPCVRVSAALFGRRSREGLVLAVNSDQPTRLGAGARFSLEGQEAMLEALASGREYIVTDMAEVSPRSDYQQTLVDERVRASLMVPLRIHGELIGALQLCSDQPGGCPGKAVDIAHEVADLLAVAIEQERLHEQVSAHAANLGRRVAERTAALQAANEELEAFAYSVSHDLRGHLWTVQGFAEFLLEKYGQQLGDEGLDYAQSILEAARAMDSLIQDLLGYSHLSRRELESGPVELEQVLNEALEHQAGLIAESGAQVAVERPLGAAVGDAAVLVQVLDNLLSNAIKFVAPGITPQLRVWTREHRHWVTLWVEDNGIGVPLEHQERIFQQFQRLNAPDQYPGTGLGLAIVLRGTSRLGGVVGTEPANGGGSRFWIALRKVEDNALAISAQQSRG